MKPLYKLMSILVLVWMPATVYAEVQDREIIYQVDGIEFTGYLAFEQEMQAAAVDYRLVSYPGVKHSFTNPEADTFARQFNMPLAYNLVADEDSWQQLQQFLNRIFK
ncbi:MAG: dienelactone hydrolase family protein [Mariprofundus sp.]|nr:dienelactone hydrolase family protein [Mariprofundus sp.]